MALQTAIPMLVGSYNAALVDCYNRVDDIVAARARADDVLGTNGFRTGTFPSLEARWGECHAFALAIAAHLSGGADKVAAVQKAFQALKDQYPNRALDPRTPHTTANAAVGALVTVINAASLTKSMSGSGVRTALQGAELTAAHDALAAAVGAE